MPRVTYTDPEVAHVGAEPDGAGGHLQTITVHLSELDRAVLNEDTDGFVRVHHDRGRLRGCTVVGPHASELIGEATLAISQAMSLSALSSTIHLYPTHGEAFRKVGEAYRRDALTPGLRRWLERYFRWMR